MKYSLHWLREETILN